MLRDLWAYVDNLDLALPAGTRPLEVDSKKAGAE